VTSPADARPGFRVFAGRFVTDRAAVFGAVVAGLLVLLAVLGGAALARLIEPISGPLRWVAAAVLVGIAARTAWSALKRRHDPAKARMADGRMGTPHGAYFALLALTLLNPATIVYFAALVLGRQSGSSTCSA